MLFRKYLLYVPRVRVVVTEITDQVKWCNTVVPLVLLVSVESKRLIECKAGLHISWQRAPVTVLIGIQQIIAIRLLQMTPTLRLGANGIAASNNNHAFKSLISFLPHWTSRWCTLH